MKHSEPLHLPSPQIAKTYISSFEADRRNRVTERALDLLLKAFPSNSELEHVLLKVVALNRLYGTNIYDVFGTASHIASLNPDFDRLEVDDDLVEQIAWRTGGHNRREYSFATKYCSWHRPDAFVIYDRRVDELLCDYQQQFQFGTFCKEELKNYPSLKRAVENFRRYLGLDELTFKEMDKFLWSYWEDLNRTNPRVKGRTRLHQRARREHTRPTSQHPPDQPPN